MTKTARPERGCRQRLVAAGAAILLAWGAACAAAERFPCSPVRLVLPSSAGGTSDLLGRLLAPHLGDALGVPVVIVARPGAAGKIATEHVATSPPDGCTLLLANNATHAANSGSHADGEPHKAFAAVGKIANLPIVVVVTPSLRVSTLAELIDYARREPAKLSYASSEFGSTSHRAATLLFDRAEVSVLHVPYAGTSTAVKDTLAAEVPVLYTHLGTVAPLIRAGKLRALAVSGAQRMKEFPGIPTIAESGFPGFDVTTWHGVVTVNSIPKRVLLRLRTALASVAALPELREQLAALGMEPVDSDAEQFAVEIGAEFPQPVDGGRTGSAWHP